MSTTQKPETNRQIVYNALQCLVCGALLESMHRHDYKTCGCPNQAMVDGGLDYLRYGAKDLTKIRHLAKYADDSFEEIRKFAFRVGSIGPSRGKAIRLYKMSNAWIENAIRDHIERGYGPKWHVLLLIKEKQYRNEKEIFIDEEESTKKLAEALETRIKASTDKALYPFTEGFTEFEKEEEVIRVPVGGSGKGKG